LCNFFAGHVNVNIPFMHKLLFLLILLWYPFNSFSAGPSARNDIDPKLKVLKEQVLIDILATHASEKEVTALFAQMREDGSWPDINYADKTRGGWTVNDHLTRLISMAILYKNAGTKWMGDQELKKKIIAGLDFWLKNDFICPNWWYPQIGVPKTLAPLMLMMEETLTPAEMEAGVKILDRAKIGMTGQNKVWLSGNVIYRSLLTGDIVSVEAAVKAIQEEIVVSEGEGIQADYSFHQHGTQQQFGNYGSAYASDMLKWASIFQNTAFRFEPAKIAILRNYLLQGMRWITWKHTMDISACGRQLFPHAQSEKANSIERILQKMPVVDAGFKEQYLSAMDDFDGNNHFWKSDMTVHRRRNFYASVKMSSVRVGGAESCNDENLQGYHLGDGATYFYLSNNEYKDIFPFWDWKMIPGTTAFHNDEPLPVLPCSGYNIASEFVGGVSDGMNGIATLDYKRDSLYAQKSWFFFEDAIVCLGAGIHSGENKEVRTTVNQSYFRGNVLVKQVAGVQTAANGEHTLEKVSWVLHDNWGYFFPGNAVIQISNRQQPGDWHNVLKRMPVVSTNENIFTLWFNHHAQPKAERYAYFVFPAATPGNIETRAAAFKVVQNTAALQVVENSKLQIAGLVFTEPAVATTKIFGKIEADKPCILMFTKKYAVQQISLADPTHKQSNLVITLQGNKKCKTVEGVFNKENNTTRFSILLPTGPEAGRTVNLVIE